MITFNVLSTALLLALSTGSCRASREVNPIYEIVFEMRNEHPGYTNVRFYVNVDKWLTADEVKDLVCELVPKVDIPNHPDRSSLVSFSFVRNIDDRDLLLRIQADAEAPEELELFLNRWIGDYRWNSGFPMEKGRGRLSIRLDAGGQTLPSELEMIFDHEEDCPAQE